MRTGRITVWFLPALAGLLILGAAAAPRAEAQAGRAGLVRVTGTVVDREAGTPVRDVVVTLGDSAYQVTGATGRFEFSSVFPGEYQVSVQRIGYRSVEDSLRVAPGANVRLDIRLVPQAVELEPVVVKARTDLGKMRGFFQRRRAGMGSYATREDIEDRNPAYVTDVLRQMRGLWVTPRRRDGSGYDVVMRGDCRPTLFVDGMRISSSVLGIDELLTPLDVQGIEVYRGPETPSQYSYNSCGAILVWTRVAERGGTASWRKVLIVTGVVGALAFILTR